MVEVAAIHFAAASEALEASSLDASSLDASSLDAPSLEPSSLEPSCLNACASDRTLTDPRGRGEMADALVSGTSGVKPVEVQVLSTAFM